jgi:hypothetical protein
MPGRPVADLEFILAVRDQFPSNMIRAVYHGLSAAYAATGQHDRAAKAAADSSLSSALYRLMERHQLQDPFRFLIYAELAGVEIGPVAA